MNKLVNTQLSAEIITRAKELIETRGWWRGIDGEARQVIDINGRPAGYLEASKRVSGYTLLGALVTAGQEISMKYHDKLGKNSDELYRADALATLFVEGAIERHCNGISYTVNAFNKDGSTSQKKVLSVLNTALSGMKEQFK